MDKVKGAVFEGEKRLMIDPSVPSDMILFPDEKTRKWFEERAKEFKPDWACHGECPAKEALKEQLSAQAKAATKADGLVKALEQLKFPQYQCVKGILNDVVPCETIEKIAHNKAIDMAIKALTEYRKEGE